MRVFPNLAALQSALDLPPLEPGAFRFAKAFAPAAFVCSDCGETISIPFEGCGTGYGTDDAGAMFCYPCGAKRAAAELIRDGRGCLYLTGTRLHGRDAKPGERMAVTDWTGELRFPVFWHDTGRHNFARVQDFVRFHGPDGFVWSGRRVGENTQICHVRRTVERSKVAA